MPLKEVGKIEEFTVFAFRGIRHVGIVSRDGSRGILVAEGMVGAATGALGATLAAFVPGEDPTLRELARIRRTGPFWRRAAIAGAPL
jgi:hypothetical protein